MFHRGDAYATVEPDDEWQDLLEGMPQYDYDFIVPICCGHCQGQGSVQGHTCPFCLGTGCFSEARVVTRLRPKWTPEDEAKAMRELCALADSGALDGVFEVIRKNRASVR